MEIRIAKQAKALEKRLRAASLMAWHGRKTDIGAFMQHARAVRISLIAPRFATATAIWTRSYGRRTIHHETFRLCSGFFYRRIWTLLPAPRYWRFRAPM